MDVNMAIRKLKSMDIEAECMCGESFRLRDAFLFDGTTTFPPEAQTARDAMKNSLEEQKKDLEKRMKNATIKLKITTESVNLGKSVEKIVPELEEFRRKWALPDCRVLSDPIDILIFNGLSRAKVDSIGFVEIKTGAAPIGKHQKAIKQAIDDGDVAYKVF